MITIADLRQIFGHTVESVLSLYLVVDPALRDNQSATPAWRSWLKTALRNIENDLEESQQATWLEIRARLEGFLDSFSPQSKTLVLYCGPDLMQPYELPISLENYASFGTPSLTLLLSALNEQNPYLITWVDQKSARFWIVAFDGIQFQGDMIRDLSQQDWRKVTAMSASSAGRHVKAGSHRDRYTDRLTEQIERFYGNVAERVAKLSDEHLASFVVLAGNQESAHAVANLICGHTVIGPVSIPHYLRSSEVLKRVSSIISKYREDQELALVEEIVQLAKSGGRGALGNEVLSALEQGCVELLVVPCSQDNQKLVDLLTIHALIAGMEIKPVSDGAAARLMAEGGVAARLYHPISP